MTFLTIDRNSTTVILFPHLLVLRHHLADPDAVEQHPGQVAVVRGCTWCTQHGIVKKQLLAVAWDQTMRDLLWRFLSCTCVFQKQINRVYCLFTLHKVLKILICLQTREDQKTKLTNSTMPARPSAMIGLFLLSKKIWSNEYLSNRWIDVLIYWHSFSLLNPTKVSRMVP